MEAFENPKIIVKFPENSYISFCHLEQESHKAMVLAPNAAWKDDYWEFSITYGRRQFTDDSQSLVTFMPDQ